MPWLWYILLVVVQVLGLFLTLLSLPGIWVMVAALVGFGWLTGWDVYVGWPGAGTAVGLAVVAEVLEFAAGSAGAKKAGGSKRAMLGAVIGGLIGGFLFSLPLPIIGTIFGVCLGCFLGATLVEVGIGKDPDHATRVGWGAAKGRFWGTVIKLAFGVIILLLSLIVAFPV